MLAKMERVLVLLAILCFLPSCAACHVGQKCKALPQVVKSQVPVSRAAGVMSQIRQELKTAEVMMAPKEWTDPETGW